MSNCLDISLWEDITSQVYNSIGTPAFHHLIMQSFYHLFLLSVLSHASLANSYIDPPPGEASSSNSFLLENSARDLMSASIGGTMNEPMVESEGCSPPSRSNPIGRSKTRARRATDCKVTTWWTQPSSSLTGPRMSLLRIISGLAATNPYSCLTTNYYCPYLTLIRLMTVMMILARDIRVHYLPNQLAPRRGMRPCFRLSRGSTSFLAASPVCTYLLSLYHTTWLLSGGVGLLYPTSGILLAISVAYTQN